MRKTFKIIISAIICLALILVPMTVMAEEGVTYNINYEKNLSEGTNNYVIDGTVPYTVYILYPTEVGEYTITSDANIGIVSYHDMWVQSEPTDDIVNLNTITWPCTDVYQAIMIAVTSDASEVSITVTREDPDASQEIPWIFYENTPAPQKFEMPDTVDVEELEDSYVDVEDDVIDDAVLGDDGYYHLNDKNGPVLFANLNDSIMSLYTMSGYGSVSAVQYDDNGDAVKKVDYTDAFNEYVAALPTDDNGSITSYYYPLTADLIEMFKEVGASHNWYDGDAPWVCASEDAWLFACYFDENLTYLELSNNNNTDDDDTNTDTDNDDINNDDTNNSENTGTGNGTATENNTTDTNTSDTNNTNNNVNADKDNTSPETGDSVAVISLAMLCASAIVCTTKKKS